MEANSILIAVGGWIFGLISAIPIKFGDGFIKEFFHKRQKLRNKKEELADKLMDVCIEGSNSGWNVMPGSQRYIQRLAAEIEATDNEVSKKLQHYLNMWCLCAIPQKTTFAANFTREDIEIATRWQNEAQVLGEELLAIARGWKK